MQWVEPSNKLTFGVPGWLAADSRLVGLRNLSKGGDVLRFHSENVWIEIFYEQNRVRGAIEGISVVDRFIGIKGCAFACHPID